MWKPVSNRTRGIMSRICKLRGGIPALLSPVGPLQISYGLIWGENDTSSIKLKCFSKSTLDASYILGKEVGWPGNE